MRLSITYLYTIVTYGYPPRLEDEYRAFADIQKMGFRYLEMESLGPEHGRAVWEHREELKKRLDDNGIHVHNFCGVDPDLVSPDEKKRAEAHERFERTAELAAFLEAETLHLASYAPPVEYPNGRPYELGQAYSVGGAHRVRIPEGFSWRRVWDVLVESCRRCAEIAGGYGKTVIMEPRVGEIIASPDSLIRLIGDVGARNFKANFDTAHISAQRESVPLALAKLEGLYANVHLADNDPATAEHLPIGDGRIDWREFFRVLGRHGYEGYLGLDLSGRERLRDDWVRSRERVQEFAAECGIQIEL
jgi:sugar phosphate isomerase/epimerase